VTFQRFSYRMIDTIKTGRIKIGTIMLACLWLISSCQFATANAADEPTQSDANPAAQNDSTPVIKTDSSLPDTHPKENYLVHLLATGGVQPLHWRLERGSLPPGIKLEDNGVLHGAAERGGEFQFTVLLRDSAQVIVRKQFSIHVRSAMSLDWKDEAHVNGNRIEGSVKVSNATPDDIDLTFVVMAVATNGRATAIGYQHFPLPKGAFEMELPFGDTLPRGGYVVHVDVVGEVASKNLIYRERMQTPKLQVTVGP
jgi:hypothetical protein